MAVVLFCPTITSAQIVFKGATYNSALPPVSVQKLRSVLDDDLAEELRTGALAPGTHGGVVIGVVQHGKKRIFTYGPVKPNEVFELGSATKAFTGLLLAQMIEQGRMQLEDPVRLYLPAGVVTKPDAAEITLRNLTTHSSGIPSNPKGVDPAHPNSRYSDYRPEDLYAYLHMRGVGRATNTKYEYGNTGVKLLGQVIVLKSGRPYDQLLREQVTGPLRMKHTAVVLSPEMKQLLAQGYDEKHQATASPTPVNLPAWAGLYSTAADMLNFLQAQLHPRNIHADGPGKTLPAAIELSHQLLGPADPGMHIAMNWFHSDADGTYQHGGIMEGYTSMVLFNPEQDFGVVVLSNTAGSTESFPIRLANHIGQRLTGSPALSLVESVSHQN